MGNSTLQARCTPMMDGPAGGDLSSKQHEKASLPVALCLAPCWLLPACCSLAREAASKLATCTWHRHWHAGMPVRIGWHHHARARVHMGTLNALMVA
jgi:hypothetical protein